MDISNFTPRINEILQTSDLATVSAKEVRQQLEREVIAALDSHEGDIDEIIKKKKQQQGHVGSMSSATHGSIYFCLSKPMKLSADLSAFLDQKYCTRTEVVKYLWKYIKGNNLQDPEDKRYIICDANLLDIFQTERMHMFALNKLLNDHLIKPTPEENAEAMVLLNLHYTHPATGESIGIVSSGKVAAQE
ncbi:hypothetical protein EV175_001899 [Coemansia sp. RSA 1933]|nr:hypothetical protein EV175_001899 [Coemansia sp. RSA 1933]